MFTAYLGHIAALFTSVSWSFTSIFFTLAGRQVGSQVVNRTRLLLAIGFAGGAHWLALGSLLPLGAEPWRWGFLSLSGLIGLVIGDACLFQAFVMIGPRLSMLLMSLSPVLSTLIAWVWLGEVLVLREIAGILLAVSGIALVVTDRHNGENTQAPQTDIKYYLGGLVFGLGGALGQAVGLVVSKRGLEGDFPALSGNLIRLLSAATVIWIVTLVQGQIGENFRRLRERPQALKTLLGGTIAGPFLGMWLSLEAVQRAPVGIASTLMSLAPIILLPVGYFLFQERITARAVGGTVIAFMGTALLFL